MLWIFHIHQIRCAQVKLTHPQRCAAAGLVGLGAVTWLWFTCMERVSSTQSCIHESAVCWVTAGERETVGGETIWQRERIRQRQTSEQTAPWISLLRVRSYRVMMTSCVLEMFHVVLLQVSDFIRFIYFGEVMISITCVCVWLNVVELDWQVFENSDSPHSLRNIFIVNFCSRATFLWTHF